MANKIDYGQSPALAFIKPQEEQGETAAETTEETPAKALKSKSKPEKLRTIVIPEGMTITPDMFIEKRSRRVQLVLRPSVYDKAKAKADSLGISFNDYVHALIDSDLADDSEA